jgi:VTC domain
MSHSRDVWPHAHEIKFVVPCAVAHQIRHWARIELDPDPHGSGPFGDEYRTTSLYLDNRALDVFHRRGSAGRSKYRIRRYGGAGVVFLERKLRQPAVLAKRRTTVPIEALTELAPPGDPRWTGRWFHRRVAARSLRPVCQVSYLRMARTIARDGETIRLTLDSDLRARPVFDYVFGDDPGLPMLSGESILELKFRGAAPLIFKRLIEQLALTPRTASKYRLGLHASMAPPVVAAGRTPSGPDAVAIHA